MSRSLWPGITGPVGSPVVSVGQAVIGLTPRPVTDFVIKVFGPHDKPVLLITIVVLLALFAAAFGIATMRRPAAGFVGLAIFAVIGLVAVATRPNSAPADVIPTLAGAAVGAYALTRLARAAGAAGETQTARPAAGGRPGAAAARPPNRVAAGRQREPRVSGATPGYDRRSFMATSGVAAVGAAAGGVAGSLLTRRSTVTHARALVKLPPPAKLLPPLAASTDLHIPGLSPFVTPNGSFYRVDTALFIPQVSPASWRLRVHGMVSRELDITFNDLLRRPLTEADITLCCVSNPVGGPYISNTRWLGVPLASVLREAGIRSGADQLLSTSTDGYTSGTPVATVMDGRNALLAVAMDGAALPVAHGFPVRMVVPGLYGYVSATKWVTDINVTTFAAAAGVLGPAGLGGARAGQDRVTHRRAERDAPRSRRAGWRWPAWRGRSTAASRRWKYGWTAARGRRHGSPPSPGSTRGGSGCGTGTPRRARISFRCAPPTRPGTRRLLLRPTPTRTVPRGGTPSR